MSTITLSSKGQVVLPADLRRRLGLGAGTKFEVIEEADGLRLRVVRTHPSVDLASIAGMLKAPTGGGVRHLRDFDPASLLARSPRPKR